MTRINNVYFIRHISQVTAEWQIKIRSFFSFRFFSKMFKKYMYQHHWKSDSRVSLWTTSKYSSILFLPNFLRFFHDQKQQLALQDISANFNFCFNKKSSHVKNPVQKYIFLEFLFLEVFSVFSARRFSLEPNLLSKTVWLRR